ncbi:MAG: beta-lactamase family protein [Emcibacteraceae bacterium]|nr:beta-lactamase family protein [Emcibacteraceae bacterium]
MFNSFKIILIITLSVIISSCKAKNTAREMFEAAAALPHVPGISVAIADQNGIIWAEGFGYANIEHQIPMDTNTKMRIGSVAKIITTAAMMKMVEQGELDLDRNIRDYIPEWPASHDPITLRQLAAHTAGVRHYNGTEFLSNTQYENSVTALDIFKNDPLNFTPGNGFSYTTYGWTVISAAMESASGNSYKQLINEHVLTPLSMNDTTFDDTAPIIKNRQSPYSFENGELVNTAQVNASYKYAGGGFLATPSDVAKFAIAHATPGYLKAETLSEMYQKLEPSPHGIGWIIGFDDYKNNYSTVSEENTDILRMMNEHPNTVMHSGGSVGGLTMMLLCLDHNRAVALTKNVSNSPGNQNDLGDHFLLALKTLDIFHNN